MFKKIIKKIIWGKKASTEEYVKYLRKKGMKIGKGLYCPSIRSIIIDETRPWMIEIGDNVTLTSGVTILTHGYDFSVIMNRYGDLYGSAGKVEIGNNVFVGINAIILKGVKIGDNVIVGAGSVVNKNVPDNTVVAGNPAKIICTLDEYISTRKVKYINEAKEMAIQYYKVYNKKPPIEIFHEFFFIMKSREEINDIDFGFINIEKVKERFLKTKPVYSNLDDFLSDCNIK